MLKISSAPDYALREMPFSYFSTNIYLDFAGYFLERNGEEIVVTQDLLYPHEFPALFLPKRSVNWECCSVSFTTHEDRRRIHDAKIPLLIEKPLGSEFFYYTEQFLNPEGSFKQKVSSFMKKYTYTLLFSYDAERVRAFYRRWRSQKDHSKSITFDESEDFFEFCLSHLDAYDVRQVYVECDGVLIGFAWGVLHEAGGWVGLHLKVDYSFAGLSRFLQHERAKLFSDRKECTLGTEADDKGIADYKRGLGPAREVLYSYILTGSREIIVS